MHKVQLTWPGLALQGSSYGDYKSSWNDVAFCLGANSPNYHDKATLYADVSLFLKIQVAFNECLTWHFVLAGRGVLGPGAIEVGESLTEIIILFSFNQVLKGENWVKIYRKCFHLEPFKVPANGNNKEHTGKCFANLPMHRALYLYSMVMVAGLHPAPSVNAVWGFKLWGLGIYLCFLFTQLLWDLEMTGIFSSLETGNWVTATIWTACFRGWICPMILVWVLEVDFTASLWLTTWLGILDRVSMRTTAG